MLIAVQSAPPPSWIEWLERAPDWIVLGIGLFVAVAAVWMVVKLFQWALRFILIALVVGTVWFALDAVLK